MKGPHPWESLPLQSVTMNWKFCVIDPQDAVLELCRGKMDEGDGIGDGIGYGIGYGDGSGDGSGYGYASGDGWGDGDGDGWGYGGSPEEWK